MFVCGQRYYRLINLPPFARTEATGQETFENEKKGFTELKEMRRIWHPQDTKAEFRFDPVSMPTVDIDELTFRN